MGGVLEGVETIGAVFVGEVEFAGGGEGEVVAHNAVDLLSHGLDCDYGLSVIFKILR